MKSESKSNKLAGASLLSAVAASLCCITPVLALISGATGIASAFSWIDPLRPYLIAITVIVLAFAWFQKLKPRKEEDIECACETDEKPSFWQSKKFLLLVTVFAAFMLAFPYYSSVFYPDHKTETVAVNPVDIKILHLDIEGMTCPACNFEIAHAAYDVKGVLSAKADYTTGKAEIRFDTTKASSQAIIQSINTTSYRVINKTTAKKE